jgi:hypothetical protein
MLGIAARKDGGNDDQMAWIKIGRCDLAFQFRIPKIVPGAELDVLDQVVAVADRVDVGPAAEMKRTEARFIDEIARVRNLGEVELLEQATVRVEPADMRRSEGDVAFRVALGELAPC